MAGPFITKLWGTTPSEGDESGDNYVSGRRGALSSKSKRLGDGFWCPACFGNGRYSWIDYIYKAPCEICKTKYSDMDKEKIAEIMKKR